MHACLLPAAISIPHKLGKRRNRLKLCADKHSLPLWRGGRSLPGLIQRTSLQLVTSSLRYAHIRRLLLLHSAVPDLHRRNAIERWLPRSSGQMLTSIIGGAGIPDVLGWARATHLRTLLPAGPPAPRPLSFILMAWFGHYQLRASAVSSWHDKSGESYCYSQVPCPVATPGPWRFA